MHADKILATVAHTIQATLNTGPMAINRQTRALEVRGWDSLSHTLILASLEEAFQCQLPLERFFQAKNVGDLVDLLSEALNTPRLPA
jgi:acyl carrier protein